MCGIVGFVNRLGAADREVVEGRKEPVRVYAAKDKAGDAA